MDPSKLTRQQKQEALESVMNLVKKRDGRIKASCAAEGSKQRRMEGYKKENATLPTVHTERVFITAVINTHTNRDGVIADIPGAFLHALTKYEIMSSCYKGDHCQRKDIN